MFQMLNRLDIAKYQCVYAAHQQRKSWEMQAEKEYRKIWCIKKRIHRYGKSNRQVELTEKQLERAAKRLEAKIRYCEAISERSSKTSY